LNGDRTIEILVANPKRERLLIGSTEPLRTGRESGAPLSPEKAALRAVGFVYLGLMVLTWPGIGR
jgi:hypothetical protein